MHLFISFFVTDFVRKKAFAEYEINVTEKLKFLLGRVRNIVGKGENAGYQHFLLFPQCFQPLEALADNKVDVNQKRKFLSREQKDCGSGRKCWFPAFRLFLVMFLKAFFRRVINS